MFGATYLKCNLIFCHSILHLILLSCLKRARLWFWSVLLLFQKCIDVKLIQRRGMIVTDWSAKDKKRSNCFGRRSPPPLLPPPPANSSQNDKVCWIWLAGASVSGNSSCNNSSRSISCSKSAKRLQYSHTIYVDIFIKSQASGLTKRLCPLIFSHIFHTRENIKYKWKYIYIHYNVYNVYRKI